MKDQDAWQLVDDALLKLDDALQAASARLRPADIVELASIYREAKSAATDRQSLGEVVRVLLIPFDRYARAADGKSLNSREAAMGAPFQDELTRLLPMMTSR